MNQILAIKELSYVTIQLSSYDSDGSWAKGAFGSIRRTARWPPGDLPKMTWSKGVSARDGRRPFPGMMDGQRCWCPTGELYVKSTLKQSVFFKETMFFFALSGSVIFFFRSS